MKGQLSGSVSELNSEKLIFAGGLPGHEINSVTSTRL